HKDVYLVKTPTWHGVLQSLIESPRASHHNHYCKEKSKGKKNSGFLRILKKEFGINEPQQPLFFWFIPHPHMDYPEDMDRVNEFGLLIFHLRSKPKRGRI